MPGAIATVVEPGYLGSQPETSFLERHVSGQPELYPILKTFSQRKSEGVSQVPGGRLVVERGIYAIDVRVAGIDPVAVRDETSAVILVMDRMDDAGDRHEYFLGIALLVGFLQLAGKAQIIAMGQEILLTPHAVPCVGKANGERFRLRASLVLGQLVRIGNVLIVRESTILVIDEVEVAQVGIQFIAVGYVTTEEPIAEQLVAVRVVIAPAIDIVHLGTDVDFLSEVQCQHTFQAVHLALAGATGGVGGVCVRYFCVVKVGVCRCCDVIIVRVGEDEVAFLLPIAEDLTLRGRSHIREVTDGQSVILYQLRGSGVQSVGIHRGYIALAKRWREPITDNPFFFQGRAVRQQQTVRNLFV